MPGLGTLKVVGALVGIALIAALGFTAMRLQTVNARLETAQSKVANLQKTNAENALEIAEFKRIQKNTEATIRAEQDRRKDIQNQLANLRSRIDDAPHDGCVGPAVHAVIDGLRVQSADHKD
ncbi:putative transcriptional regulator [Thalassospira sp. MBR-102]|jgi:predicted transcriptional regulator|uniref:hypothetical protein n=1 Tax=Thalassospira sp. MBR-102 TaxID=3156466 RepID=UPI00339090B2